MRARLAGSLNRSNFRMVQSQSMRRDSFSKREIKVAKSHGKHAKAKAKASKKNEINEGATEVLPAAGEGLAAGGASADDTVALEKSSLGVDSPKAESPRDKAAAREAAAKAPFDDDEFAPGGFDADETVAFDAVSGEGQTREVLDDGYVAAFDAYTPAVPSNQENEPKKKRNAKKIAGIVCASIAGALALVYVAGIIVFSNWYYPGTTIGSIDASMKSTGDVKDELLSAVNGYKVRIVGDGFDYELDMAKVGVTIDADTIARQMHDALPAWQWPVLISQQNHRLTDLFVTDYSGSTELNDNIRAKVEEFNKTATQPQNATIEYDSAKKQFVVKSEVAGTALNADAVIKAADAAILSFQPTVSLGEDELAKPTVLSTDERLKTAAETATRMSSVTLNLTMAGHDAGSIGPDQFSQWIKLGDDYSVTLDSDAVNNYVTELESNLDTVGSRRTYTRADGKVITVSGGVYGWEVDGDALRASINDAVNSGTSQEIDIPCTSTGAEYNGAGKKDWGNRYVDIDLAEQHVRMYDDSGALVWESDCISGIPDGSHDTSVGVYWVNSKASPSKLIGYENGKKIYESTVRYWMPFDGNAIGLHDADWQPDFGGTMYRDGYGSHGCVNLPVDAAAQLYQILQEGDCVASHW